MVPRMGKVVAASPSPTGSIENRICKRDVLTSCPTPSRQFDHVTRRPGQHSAAPFVSVTRLARQNGFDVLIEAFRKVAASGLDALDDCWRRSEHEALEALIALLGLGGRIRLAGYIAWLGKELAEADCFVRASRSEGFGVAIVERMSAGLYVIATDCEFGPSDLIDSPEEGKIVQSEVVDALASGIAAFMRGGKGDGGERTCREAAAVFGLDHVMRHAAMLRATAGRAS